MSDQPTRRRCLNCPKFFECQTGKGTTRGSSEQKFCSPNCRKEFHRHQGAYAKLRTLVEELTRKEVKRVLSEVIDERIKELQIDSRLEVVHVRLDELRQVVDRVRVKVRALENASATPKTSPQTPGVDSSRTPGTSPPSSRP